MCENTERLTRESVKKIAKEVAKSVAAEKIEANNFWLDYDKLFERINFGKRVESEVAKKLTYLNSEYLRINLPGMVKKETKDCVEKYMPKYLSSNGKFQELLTQHLGMVRAQVEKTGQEVIERLVQEDKYKVVNQAFKDELANENRHTFNLLADQLRMSRDEFDKKAEKIDRLARENVQLKDTLSYIQVGCFLIATSVCGICSVFGYHVLTRK